MVLCTKAKFPRNPKVQMYASFDGVVCSSWRKLAICRPNCKWIEESSFSKILVNKRKQVSQSRDTSICTNDLILTSPDACQKPPQLKYRTRLKGWMWILLVYQSYQKTFLSADHIRMHKWMMTLMIIQWNSISACIYIKKA